MGGKTEGVCLIKKRTLGRVFRMDVRQGKAQRSEVMQWNQKEIIRDHAVRAHLPHIGANLQAIYTLEKPDTGVVRYVGNTINIRGRLLDHLQLQSAPLVQEWITGLEQEGLLPRLCIIRFEHMRSAWAVEKKLIIKYSRNRCLLKHTHNPYSLKLKKAL